MYHCGIHLDSVFLAFFLLKLNRFYIAFQTEKHMSNFNPYFNIITHSFSFSFSVYILYNI